MKANTKKGNAEFEDRFEKQRLGHLANGTSPSEKKIGAIRGEKNGGMVVVHLDKTEQAFESVLDLLLWMAS